MWQSDVIWYVWYVALALGIPGNILSAIVWLQLRKSSSAVYLAALAVDNLAYQLLEITFLHCGAGGWLCDSVWHMGWSMAILEPLLVLGFSVERLIAILRPLQVCRVRFTLTHTITN